MISSLFLCLLAFLFRNKQRQAEQKMTELLEIMNTVSPMCVTNPEYKITMANRAYIDVFGEVEKNGERVTCFDSRRGDCCHSGSCPLVKLKTMGRSELVSEMVKYMNDGTNRHFIVSSRALQDTKGKVVALLECFQDVTTIKQLTAEKEKLNNLASLGVIAGGIAHDFNNLLQVIVGNISLAQLLIPDSGAEEIAPILRAVEKASFQAKELTQKILTFSKGGNPRLKPTDLTEILQRTLKGALAQGKVSVQLNIDTNLHLVNADESQLQQAMGNIITNAEEAMPDGGALWVAASNCDLAEVQEHLCDQAPPRSLNTCISSCGILARGFRRTIWPKSLTRTSPAKEKGARRAQVLGYQRSIPLSRNIRALSMWSQRPGMARQFICISLPVENGVARVMKQKSGPP